VLDLAPRERQHVVAPRKVGVGGVGRLVGDFRLVDAGWQHVDQIDIGGEFLVFFASHAPGHKNAQVADAFMYRVNNRLVVRNVFGVVLVQVGNPAQRLRRRSDVVALGAEHTNGRADIAQVDAYAVGRDQARGGQPIADEQVV